MSSRPKETPPTVAVIGPQFYVRQPNGSIVRREQPSQADLAAAFAQQPKAKKRKPRKTYDFDRILDGNLNSLTKRFLKKLEERKVFENFQWNISKLVWKSLTVWGVCGVYVPQYGDAVKVVYDEGDDTGVTLVLYWSKASNWVVQRPDSVHRTYLFNLYAQAGSSGQSGMPFGLETLSPTGELVLWRT